MRDEKSCNIISERSTNRTFGAQTQGKYGVLQSIMNSFGATCSSEDFYWAVNEAYHTAESTCYDLVHNDMYEEEERIWKYLLDMVPFKPGMRFLDVGCGTGLVGHFVVQMCPHLVGEMHMLDPNSAMIEIAREKTNNWPFRTYFHHGDIFSLAATPLYDVVTINSVLHHVVELEPFLRRVQDVIMPKGRLLIAQDPRSGANHDSILCERKASVAARLKSQVPFLSRMRFSMAKIVKNVFGIERHGPLADATNELLLEKGIITKPMDSKTIWAVTDFHVPCQPGNFGKGIDILDCEMWMPNMKLNSTRTYHFHDTAWLKLTDIERRQEENWWSISDQHGSLMAAVFQKIGTGI